VKNQKGWPQRRKAGGEVLKGRGGGPKMKLTEERSGFVNQKNFALQLAAI